MYETSAAGEHDDTVRVVGGGSVNMDALLIGPKCYILLVGAETVRLWSICPHRGRMKSRTSMRCAGHPYSTRHTSVQLLHQ